MLKERTKAQDAVDLKCALARLEVDRQGNVKKIKDVCFNPLHATFAFEVKKYMQDVLILRLGVINSLRCCM